MSTKCTLFYEDLEGRSVHVYADVCEPGQIFVSLSVTEQIDFTARPGFLEFSMPTELWNVITDQNRWNRNCWKIANEKLEESKGEK